MKCRIGFIGTGVMGLPMAKNLSAMGFPLVGYGLRPEPVRELVAPRSRGGILAEGGGREK